MTGSPPPRTGPSLADELAQADQLLQEGRLEIAAVLFQRLLERHPHDARVLHGYQQVRALLAARDPLPERLLPTPGPVSLPAPVGPPPTVMSRSAAPREGIHLPKGFRPPRPPRWLRRRRNLWLLAGLGALIMVGLGVYGARIREAALREAVASARKAALKPVERMVDTPSLAESTESVRQEAEGSLERDALVAYYRAQEWKRRAPDEPAAADLVNRARQRLAGHSPSCTLDSFDRELQSGDLDDARTCILDLLRQAPDDPDLKARTRKVELALAPRYVLQDRLDDAEDALRMGRAMYPGDRTWAARLKLLSALRGMARSERPAWAQLLG